MATDFSKQMYYAVQEHIEAAVGRKLTDKELRHLTDAIMPQVARSLVAIVASVQEAQLRAKAAEEARAAAQAEQSASAPAAAPESASPAPASAPAAEAPAASVDSAPADSSKPS